MLVVRAKLGPPITRQAAEQAPGAHMHLPICQRSAAEQEQGGGQQGAAASMDVWMAEQGRAQHSAEQHSIAQQAQREAHLGVAGGRHAGKVVAPGVPGHILDSKPGRAARAGSEMDRQSWRTKGGAVRRGGQGGKNRAGRRGAG